MDHRRVVGDGGGKREARGTGECPHLVPTGLRAPFDPARSDHDPDGRETPGTLKGDLR